MNKIRSLAKRFKLDRHEKPKRASAKKNSPAEDGRCKRSPSAHGSQYKPNLFWKPSMPFLPGVSFINPMANEENDTYATWK